MGIFSAFLFGIIEGITEFLPVSSTGHLILAQRLFGLENSDFLPSFTVCIQLGAVLAVVALYGRTLFADKRLIGKITVAFLPTAVTGFVFYGTVRKFFLGNALVVAWALLLGGIFLIVFERLYHEKEGAVDAAARMSYKTAVLIGMFQSSAIVPGVSRSAATIIGGLVLGLKRKTTVEFSFFLAVPTIFAASGWDLIHNVQNFSGGQLKCLWVGFITSFVVAVASIKCLLNFIKNHSFTAFGVYRIIVALLFFAGYAAG